MELLDYLKWRNDISLSVSPFNDIDNVILSYISYMDFDELFSDTEGIYSIEEVLKTFCEKHSLEEIREKGQFTERAPLLLEQMVAGERFRETRIGYYRDIFDKEKIKQFSAVTFFLPDKTNYIAFRGTDSTITGWKEDFMMSCMSETEGTKEALDYLNDVSKLIKDDFMLGGHSKGGNFAMYAAAFCNDEIKKHITKIYNNDGPGFREEIINTEEYKQIVNKIYSIVPQTSIIGQLLSNEGEQKVVKSSAKGIFQHDAMTWEVMRDEFVESKLDDMSNFINVSLGTWLEKTDDETRESLVSTVFALIEETEAKTFKEFGGNLLKNVGIIIKSLAKLPKEKRDELISAFSGVLQAGGEAVIDNISISKNKG